MLPSLPASTRFRDPNWMVIHPEAELKRGGQISRRAPPPPPPVKLANGLSMASLALLLAFIWALWQWHKSSMQAAEAKDAVAMSWAFADGVLDELKVMRRDAALLDKDRKELLCELDKREQQGRSLKTELNSWQQKHRELEGESERTLAQWSAYGEQLRQNLGKSENKLNETSSTLQQERSLAHERLTQLDEEKNDIARAKEAVETEANALDRKARSLGQENGQLQHEVGSLQNEASRLRGDVSSLESDKSHLLSCNASLSSENSSLRSEVCSLKNCINNLESRIRCLENELARAKDDNKKTR